MEIKSIYGIALIFLICHLVIFAKDYKGGEFRTIDAYTYGRFEVRYKASAGSGQTSTFFTYHDYTSGGSNNWNEIDIEILGRYTDDVQFNTITPGQMNHVHHQWVSFNPTLDFHTYAIEWTPEYVAWFIDGDEAYRQTGEHVSILDKPQKIMMNIWNPVYSNWVGEWNDNILPLFAYYDWVSYASYTPESGNSGTNSNFTFEWIDNFDYWDQSRWEKATHTFPGNMCDFCPDNIVFQDGFMILCLTDNDNPGYVDRNSPSVLWARASGNSVVVAFSEEVEKTSAENTSNYLIQGVSISNARLLCDNRTVELAVSGLELTNQYNIVVLGIKDRSVTPNTLMGQVVNIIMPLPLSFPININVGGEIHDRYLSDQEWSEHVEYGYLDGGTTQWSPGLEINGTNEDEIYRAEHWGIVKYKVRVPKGTYKVTLMMAENNFDEAGSRVFDINAEGKYIVRNLDIYQEVGKNTAYDITAENVVVTDGILNIHFGALKDNALLNGLIIETVATEAFDEVDIPPDNFYIGQNYPNPFNSSTTIKYILAESSYVSITIYDINGRKVETLFQENQRAGYYQVFWYPQVVSGIYFYKIEVISGDRIFTEIKKMLLIK